MYCEGDATAFEALYARLAPKLLGYLRFLVGDQASAEDLLQQTFMKLHASRGAYILGADPVPWLYAIAHRTCLDEMRRRRRSRVRLELDGHSAREVEAALCGRPIDALRNDKADEEAVARMLAALKTLPDQQRLAIVLTKLHGLSGAQAAAVLGTTTGAVKQRVHRAYLTLREVLAKDDADQQGPDEEPVAPMGGRCEDAEST
jgi:RNA polymerase sigma-70 factor (ECF subfamily)